MTLVGCVYSAGYPRRTFADLRLGACVLLTLLRKARHGDGDVLVAPVVFPLYTASRLILPLRALAVVAVGIVLHADRAKEILRVGQRPLSEAFQGDYAGTAGRFRGLARDLDEAWCHPQLGAGVGSAYDFVPLVWEDINHVHNDYLRVFFEMGIIGEMIFVTTMIWQLVVLYRRTQTTRSKDSQRFCCRVSWLVCLAHKLHH